MSAHAGGISAPVSGGNGLAVRTPRLSNGRSCAIIVPKNGDKPSAGSSLLCQSGPLYPLSTRKCSDARSLSQLSLFSLPATSSAPAPLRLCVFYFHILQRKGPEASSISEMDKMAAYVPVPQCITGYLLCNKMLEFARFFSGLLFFRRGAMAPPAPTNAGPLSARRMKQGCLAGDSGIASRRCYG